MRCNVTAVMQFTYLTVINIVGKVHTELIHPSWGSSTHSALARMVSKLKTDTETSEIERDLCAFGSIGGSAPAPIYSTLDLACNFDCDLLDDHR